MLVATRRVLLTLSALAVSVPAFGKAPEKAASTPDNSAPEPSAESSLQALRMCVSSHTGAQLLRREGKLLETRALLGACSRPACPVAVRDDCINWYAEVDKSIPSVVIGARSDEVDEVEVRVFMDGKPLADKLDGKAIELDPGEHRFRFEAASYPAIERTLLVREGEKNRDLSVRFSDPTRKKPDLTQQSFTHKPEVWLEYRPTRPLTYALAGVGVLGVGSFVYFASKGLRDRKKLEDCKPLCSQDDLKPIKNDFLIADVSLGVGLLAATGSLITHLTRPGQRRIHEMPAQHRPTPRFANCCKATLAPAKSGVRLHVGGTF